MRNKEVCEDIQRLVRQRPFRPFMVNFENGDRAVVQHPETVAFDPAGRSNRLFVISGEACIFSTLDAATSVILQATGQTIGA